MIRDRFLRAEFIKISFETSIYSYAFHMFAICFWGRIYIDTFNIPNGSTS